MGAQPMAADLRLITYLAPGLPLALFAGVAEYLGRALGCSTSLISDASRSGPEPGGSEPFSEGACELGFLCAPAYLWLARPPAPVVELVPAAFVFDDARNGDRPTYFADLVVAPGTRARALDELAGARWGYNDRSSLSGYFSVLFELERRGLGSGHFSAAVALGSHHAALDAVEQGTIDCAAIDSNTLLLEQRAGRRRRVRVLESFGPYPVQPVVVRTALAAERRRALAAALLAMHDDPAGGRILAACAVRRLAPVSDGDYDFERALLARAEAAHPRPPCARASDTA